MTGNTNNSMAELKTICFGCLTNEENCLSVYNVQTEVFKGILQMDHVSLCYICKKLAYRAEMFIQSIQTNQLLMENFDNGKNEEFETVRSQTQPLIYLTRYMQDVIDINADENEVLSDRFDPVKVKLELKEEEETELYQFEGFDDNDADFHPIVKEEPDYDLKEQLGFDINSDEDFGTLSEEPKKKADAAKIKVIRITKKQCLAERAQMCLDEKYISCPYKCTDCIKGFAVKGAYDTHMEKHSKSLGDFVCSICKQRMDSEDKLQRHMKYHQIRYQCMECGLTRVCRITIKDHYTAYHASGHYVCPHCLKDFRREVSLRKHIRYTHRPKQRAACAYCGKTYANKDVLKVHLRKYHSKDMCAPEYIKQFKCNECGMAFSCPSHLKKHITKHSDRRDFYCVECDKSFKTMYILKHHLKTAAPHTNYIELPLACDSCDKRFSIRRDLDRHKNSVHLNIKPHQCDRCDKAYVNDWSLADHKRRIHEGYKRPMKYQCPMCDKAFDRNQILKGHIRTHTGERPYQCSRCPAAFSQASILGTHVKLIHLKLTRDGKPKAQIK